MLHGDRQSNLFNRGCRQIFPGVRSANRLWRLKLSRRLLTSRLQSDRSWGHFHLCRKGHVINGMRGRVVLTILRERRERHHSGEQCQGGYAQPDSLGQVLPSELFADLGLVMHVAI